MANPKEQARNCPTREDGTEVLISHTISLPTCQARQRAMYHKCFLCVFHNDGPGAVAAPVVNLTPPVRRAAPPVSDAEPAPRRVATG